MAVVKASIGLATCCAAACVAWAAGVQAGVPAPARGEQAAKTDGLIASAEAGWPQWRGPRRDGVCDEKGLLASWPQGGPKLLWKVSGLGRGYSAPIVTGRTLYITGDVGAELHIFALGLDGRRKWLAKNGRSWKRPHPGARASCAFSEGRLYHMNAHGRTVCLDAATGRELWAVNVLERFRGRNIRWGLSECLLVDGQRVVVTPGGSKGLMAALDKTTGRTVWASEAVPGEKAGYASPILFAYGGRRILAGCSSRHAFGVDAETGKLLWKHPRPTRYEVIGATPVYCGGAVFVTSPDGRGGALFRISVDGRNVSAAEAWTSPLDNVHGGVVLKGGFLYGSGHWNIKGWACVDVRTGKVAYQTSDLAIGSAIRADGRLYCLSERGIMALLKPAPKGFETLGRFRLAKPTGKVPDVWTHPVICDGRLYLRYHQTLFCYDIRAKRQADTNKAMGRKQAARREGG